MEPPSLWRPQAQFNYDVFCGEQLDRLNNGGGIAVNFEGLPKSPVHIAFAGSQSRTLSVWTTRTLYGFRSTPKLSADLLTIRFVESGYLSRTSRYESNTHVNPYRALLTSFDAMRHEHASPGFSSITAAVSCEAVLRAVQALCGSDAARAPEFCPIANPSSVGMRALRQTLALLCDQRPNFDDQNDLMTPLLQDLLTYQLICAWPKLGEFFEDGIAEIAQRPVARALDYIEANLRRKLEIGEIAVASGVSVRALQIAFKRRMNCSPVQYVIMRRLDEVHSTLLSGDERQIRQIARDWGFVHMSDFSRRYRERFGHTPRNVTAD